MLTMLSQSHVCHVFSLVSLITAVKAGSIPDPSDMSAPWQSKSIPVASNYLKRFRGLVDSSNKTDSANIPSCDKYAVPVMANAVPRKGLKPSEQSYCMGPVCGPICCGGFMKMRKDFIVLRPGQTTAATNRFEVTLVTHGDSARASALLPTLAAWSGPIVAAFALPCITDQATEEAAAAALEDLTHLVRFWRSNVRVMAVQLRNPHGQDWFDKYMGKSDASLLNMYPINALRNLVADEAMTAWIFPLDIDFLPSPTLYTSLTTTVLTQAVQVRELGLRTQMVCDLFLVCKS